MNSLPDLYWERENGVEVVDIVVKKMTAGEGILYTHLLNLSFLEPAPEIPAGHRCQSVAGFVEELVVNDDPEYQWIDKIRTPRASNEARQTLFSKLSGELQRKIGLKVLELGGNAVIGLVNKVFVKHRAESSPHI